MRRELRAVSSGEVRGAIDDTRPDPFEGLARDALSTMRRQFGDRETVSRVMREGWSNGYLYFAEPRS